MEQRLKMENICVIMYLFYNIAVGLIKAERSPADSL